MLTRATLTVPVFDRTVHTVGAHAPMWDVERGSWESTRPTGRVSSWPVVPDVVYRAKMAQERLNNRLARKAEAHAPTPMPEGWRSFSGTDF